MPKAPTYKLYIGGEWRPSSSGEAFPSINPSTLENVGGFAKGTAEDARAAVDAAEEAQRSWAEVPAPRRARVLYKAAALLAERKADLARLETMEMGKVLLEAQADVQEAIDYAEYFAGEGRRLFGHTTPSELEQKWALTKRVPVGVVSCITPWNFPIAIPALKIMPALVAGNAVVFKPSSDTPLCGVRLAEILDQAGLPPGVLNLVTGPGESVGAEIVKNRKVRGVSFTGHKDTGLWITQNAGIKRLGLELGSKNAIIVMDDADLRLALDGSLWGAFATSGQRCSAASRIIVHESVRSKFEDAFVDRAKRLRVGYSLEEDVDIGPLVNAKQLEKVQGYTRLAEQEGAKLCCGGQRYRHPKLKGFFYQPTVFTDARPEMRFATEEIFGPSVALMPVESFEQAIEALNSVEYGLTAAIYTRDINRAMRAADLIESGSVYVNAPTIGAEAHLPWGGLKQSGIGKEGGIEGIHEFTETKVVYIDFSQRLQRAQIESAEKTKGKKANK